MKRCIIWFWYHNELRKDIFENYISFSITEGERFVRVITNYDITRVYMSPACNTIVTASDIKRECIYPTHTIQEIIKEEE